MIRSKGNNIIIIAFANSTFFSIGACIE